VSGVSLKGAYLDFDTYLFSLCSAAGAVGTSKAAHLNLEINMSTLTLVIMDAPGGVHGSRGVRAVP
jgi:hypothetical protein